MKIKSYLFTAIFALTLFSCTNEEESDYNTNQNRIEESQSQSAGGGMDELIPDDTNGGSGLAPCQTNSYVMGDCNVSGSYGGGVVIGGQGGCNKLNFKGNYVRNANNTISLSNLVLTVGPTNTITVASKTVFYNSQTDEVWIDVTFKESITIPSNQAPYYATTYSYFTRKFILNTCAKTLK